MKKDNITGMNIDETIAMLERECEGYRAAVVILCNAIDALKDRRVLKLARDNGLYEGCPLLGIPELEQEIERREWKYPEEWKSGNVFKLVHINHDGTFDLGIDCYNSNFPLKLVKAMRQAYIEKYGDGDNEL